MRHSASMCWHTNGCLNSMIDIHPKKFSNAFSFKIQISMKPFPCTNDNKSVLAQEMAWWRTGNGSLPEIKLAQLHYWTLQWGHNGRESVSNHQPHDCLLNRLFRRRSKKTSKLRVTGLCAGNSSVTGEFPAQMASNAENVSIWWRHHVTDASISF